MINRSKITSAEMDALFNSEDSQIDSEALESSFLIRIALIVAIWLIRIIVVSFFPEYHMVSKYESNILPYETTNFLLYMRIFLFMVVGSIYFLSFHTQILFAQFNAFTIVIVSCLIWSDFEMYIIDNIQDLSMASLGMIALRFVALSLLIANFMALQKRGIGLWLVSWRHKSFSNQSHTSCCPFQSVIHPVLSLFSVVQTREDYRKRIQFFL